MLTSERKEQGYFGYPVQSPERRDILSKQVVLYYPAIFLLVAFNDGKIIVFHQGRSVDRLSCPLIWGTFALNDIRWHEEADTAIRTAAFFCVLGVAVLALDMVVEETSRFRTRMGDKRFLLGQFEFECVAQELPQLLLNFLRFLSRASEPKEGIIRITHIAKSPIGLVIRVKRGKFLVLLPQLPGFFLVPSLLLPIGFAAQCFICGVSLYAFLLAYKPE